MNIPLIDDLKRDFVIRRVVQTFLGGAKLKIGYKAPICVYILQILVLLMPCFIGIVFVTVTEMKIMSYPQYMYGFGVVMFCFVFLNQCFSRNTNRKVSQISDIKKKSNVLSENDQIEFISCCSFEMMQFVIPPKKHFVNVIFHGLVSAVMCGMGIHFMLPSIMQKFWKDNALMWLMMIAGWFSLCVAQYSLTTVGPPEPAVYQPLDHYEVSAVSRAFYVIAVFSIFSGQLGESFVFNGEYIHVILVLLLLLWCLNVLPPADVLVLWLVEQFLIHFLGGSPQISNIRLCFMFILSSCVVVIVHYIPYVMLSKIILVTFSNLLSINMGLLIDKIIQIFNNCLFGNVSPKPPTVGNDNNCHHFLFYIHHIAVTVITTILSVIKDVFLWRSEQNDLIQYICWISLIIIWSLSYLLSSVQSVYLFCGSVHNPLYPSSCINVKEFKRNKLKLHWIGTIRFILLKLGLFLAIFYLSILDYELKPDCTSWPCWLYIIAVTRAYRSVWQNLDSALVDIIITHLIYLFKITFMTEYDFVISLMFIAFIRDRIVQIFHKLYVIIIITVTSVTLSKQRLWYNWWLVGLDIIFSPIILLIVVASSVLAAPLLPLFTLPIFLFSFPRPLKFWPNAATAGKSSTETVCSDAVYYKQLAPRLASCLSTAIRYGSLGYFHASNQYVLRFEDRMIWIQVLEHGHNYVTMVMKGLELQETSCHTVEAAEIDVLFEQAFNYRDLRRCVNSRCYNCVTPLDTVAVKSYSDCKNVLTGIIDSPDTLKSIPKLFPKILSFILLSHSAKCALDQATEVQIETNVERQPSSLSMKSADKLMVYESPETINGFSQSQTINVDVEEKWADPVDSSWSDDGEDPLGEEVSNRNSAIYLTSLSSMHDQSTLPGFTGSIEHLDQIMMSDYGAPVSDTSKSNDSPELKETLLFEEPPLGHSDFCQYSCLGLKSSWVHTPREKSAKWQHFSAAWLQDALKIVLNAHKSVNELNRYFCDASVMAVYQNIVTCCTRAFFGENGNTPDPHEVYRTFLGDLQWSITAEWLRQNDDLMALALQAYRYCVKIAVDNALFESELEGDNGNELFKQTTDLMNNWFVGPDNSKAWNTAVQNEKPNLFSLGHNSFQNNFTGHLLTLQEMPVHIGKLNSEMVRAIWATLNLELLYFTNDDEERYSIQAHPVILRNLTVQAADPPLGYPLYISAPITMYI
ncbi:Pecanex-like protein 4 [Nymphon striatum]|nr:Pecanex-like protein 4 [Nymphon striatum]